MKGMLANLPVFVLAFILVSAAIIYMNGAYKNIWKGDFTPVGIKKVVMIPRVTKIKKEEVREFLLQKIEPELKEHFEQYQPKKIVDTVFENIVIDEALLDSFRVLHKKIESLREELTAQIAKAKSERKKKNKTTPVKKKVDKKDDYKATAKLLESMNPQRAAKVISYYSDNKAREIIKLMKTRKAAKLMEVMDPAKIAKIMGKS